MKKLLLLSFVSMALVIPQIYSISFAEYIKQHGVPEIEDGVLDLARKNITDLEGLQKELQNIPKEVRDQILVLDLSRNQLQTLPMGIFNGLQNLQYLDLSYNQLQTLPMSIFNGLQNLRHLILSYNQLQTLPMGIFNGLNNLKQLVLKNNQLKTLPIGIFNGLNNLKSLNLRENRLQTLPVGIFNGLNNLKWLFLNWNQIQTLPIGVFNGLNNLEGLDLYGNPFSGEFLLTLPTLIKSIPTLTDLDNKPIDEALKSYRVYQPKSLQETSAGAVAKNFTPAQLENLAETNPTAFELLPLSQKQKTAIAQPIAIRLAKAGDLAINAVPLPAQQKAEIIAQNMDAYRDRLHLLSSDILELLPLTAQQRAGIAAQKRQLNQ